MATQYDNIGGLFNEMAQTPAARLIEHNVHSATSPFIKGAKVLDLACGTGHYSNSLISWGASSVLGVDISSAMIKAAKIGAISQNLKFEVADCSVPKVFGSGEYDIVLAVWLLNYAATREQMVDMFRTIVMNLKDGGTFIGVTPFPTDDPRSHDERAIESRPKLPGNVFAIPKGDVADGIVEHVVASVDSGTLEFDCYHLRKTVYEESAREGGLMGELTWKSLDLPECRLDDPDGRRDAEFYQSYATYGQFGLLVISKD